MKSVLQMARAGRVVNLLGVALGVLLFSFSLFSQGSNGRILGTVTDQTGGVISGATITIIDKDRGVARTLTTDAAGEYDAPTLLPGTYIVRAEANGFRRLERQNVVLEVAKEIRVDLTVQPGEQTQTVTVTEAIPLVETTNATLGGTLNNAEIQDLPLNGRNYQNLLSLRPGVMVQPGGSPWTQSVNGVRPDETVWMVEGVINVNFHDYRPLANSPSPFTDGATILPIDAIQEFNLEENPKAEYGWKPGATVNVGIKSGTNNLHGSAYAFGRFTDWAARNFYDPGPAGACPNCKDILPTQLEQFGGVVGGPIKKDKLFFFGGYEGLRSFVGNALGSSVPALGSLGGDAKNSMVDAILALQNAKPAAVPVSAISKALVGCPSGPLTAASVCTGGLIQNAAVNSTTYTSSFPNTNTSDNGIGKIDYAISDKNRISGMVFISHYLANGEDHPVTASYWENSNPLKAYTATGNWTFLPSSTVVNEVRFSYNKVSFTLLPDDANLFANGTDYALNTGITSTGGFPGVEISGFAGQVLGSWRGRPTTFDTHYYDFQDNLSYLRGKHAFKFGVEYAPIYDFFNNHDTRGRIQFRGNKTPGISTGSTPLEDFFAGKPGRAFLLTGTTARTYTFNSIAEFVQDDWRVTPKLIVNLGLRYSFVTPLKEKNDLLGNFDPTLGMVQQGQSSVGNTLWKTDHKDFSPRLGFAYDLSGKGTTVIRGGGSIIYSMFNPAQFLASSPNNFGGGTLAGVPTSACNMAVPIGQTCSGVGGQTFGGTIDLGTPTIGASNLNWNGPVFPTGAGLSCTAAKQCNMMAVDPNYVAPYIVNWTLGVQHAFTSNLSLDVSYVGTHGSRLTNFVSLNQAPAGAGFCLNSPLTAAQTNPLTGDCAGGPISIANVLANGADGTAEQQARPFNTKFNYLQFIDQTRNNGRSNYNSLQSTVTERFSHGLSFTAGYTFGHGLDNGSLSRFGNLPQDSSNPAAEYASGDFDVRHRLTVTASYNIPGMKGFGQLLEGWRLNSIVTVQSGQPWYVNDTSFDFSGSGDTADRWNFFGNPKDFTSGASSIPTCQGFGVTPTGGVDTSGVTCTSLSGVSGLFSTLPSSLAAKCTAVAPDPVTLSMGGCFVNGNSVMVPPKLGTFGTMGRNIFRDQGFKNVDFSVFKTFKFTERFGAEFRVELFNLFNNPIVANPYGASNGSGLGIDPSGANAFGGGGATPDVAAGNPLVGSGSNRVMQLGLKLTF